MPQAGDSFKLAETVAEMSLMRRIGAGDREAFAEVIGAQQQRVWAVALRFTRQREDAEDITQEVFIRLWKAAPRWEPAARLSTWLYRVTANLCMDYRGKKSRGDVSLSGDVAATTAGLTEAMKAADTAARVQKAVGALPERQRMAVILHRFEGLSYEEMAKVTQWSEAAIESLLSRAYGTLRKELADLRIIK
jgi:RNA polymerase sigma-70 factor, ECF subfamily